MKPKGAGRGILITGSNGGIGASLVRIFSEAGWIVVGVDRSGAPAPGAAHAVNADIAEFCEDEKKLASFAADVRRALGGAPLGALVNNAAVQILGGVGELTSADFMTTMKVNAIAPFMLVKAFRADLEAAEGSVINIGSVHAQATKPKFAAYATSKAAMHGLTQALAVDLGPKIRVNTLAPAATATTMLKAGFEGDPEGYAALEGVHPLGRIAEPDEIARIALFLASKDASFLTGATIYADGGILSRLHDPA
jgi:NAD(P)-dependent dehydrogenase (short-subunit alcohol dehydrogenase family)